MENFKKVLFDTLMNMMSMFMIFLGATAVTYLIVEPLTVGSFISGIAGIWILSPAVELWKNTFRGWFSKESKN
jgi:hypothetical protein